MSNRSINRFYSDINKNGKWNLENYNRKNTHFWYDLFFCLSLKKFHSSNLIYLFRHSIRNHSGRWWFFEHISLVMVSRAFNRYKHNKYGWIVGAFSSSFFLHLTTLRNQYDTNRGHSFFLGKLIGFTYLNSMVNAFFCRYWLVLVLLVLLVMVVLLFFWSLHCVFRLILFD